MSSDVKLDAPPVSDASPLLPAPLTHQARAEYVPSGLDECLDRIRVYFDAFAPARETWRKRNRGYHAELERNFRYYIPKDASVLEVGSADGNLLAALLPSRGLGIDVSPKMIETARLRHPHLRFECSALEKFTPTGETYDYIVLSDVVGFVYDIMKFFEKLKPFCHARTRIVLNKHSRLWQPLLSLAEFLGLKYRQPVLNWVTNEDVTNLFRLAGFETIQTDSRILLPKRIPLLSSVCNRVLAPFWPFRELCVSNWIVARLPQPPKSCDEAAPALSVSVICPCRNEAGNIPAIVKRLPKFGSRLELIFVEGNSKDDTYDACLKAQANNPQANNPQANNPQANNPQMAISVYKQSGRGKKDAVWLGFEKARGDVLLILDADLSVPPEDLPAFYNMIASGSAEFVNGSRLVYPMENKAMRFLNLLGNKFFSRAFSFLIGQHVKDTLCGTKVLLRTDYERLAAGRSYFGDFDPFGDFDLLFGAAKLGLKIVDLPIRYRERVYGETQISRFKHGWMLLKMCALGLLRLKMR